MGGERHGWAVRRGVLAVSLIALSVPLLAGCGSDSGDSKTSNAVPPEVVQRAEQASTARAKVLATQVKDRYLPGPVVLKVVCIEPDPPPQDNTPYQLKCHIEGFGTPPDNEGVRFMTSEDWTVPVDADGKVGPVSRAGTARIRAYRRLDNKLNCTNRKVRPERCTLPVPAIDENP